LSASDVRCGIGVTCDPELHAGGYAVPNAERTRDLKSGRDNGTKMQRNEHHPALNPAPIFDVSDSLLVQRD